MNIQEYIGRNKKIIVMVIATNIVMFAIFALVMTMFIFLNRAPIGAFLLGGRVEKDIRTGEPTVTRDVVSEENRIVDIVEKVDSAVVSIVITKNVPIIEQYYENGSPFNGFPDDDPFSIFGIPMPKQRQKGTEKREIGGGSGFFVSREGLVMTNRHVIEDEDASYTIFTSDGKKYEAEVVAKDPFLDIALLQVKKGGNNFTHLSFGDSGRLKPGQTVIAIGNPLGEFRNSVSVGVISGLSRSIVAGDGMGNSEQLEEVIQTDAAINPGNSGGPLLNINGEVIGVNVAIAVGSENIAFALPSNVVKGTVTSVKETGEIIRPYIGVRYVLVNAGLKEKNKLSVDYGALVARGETMQDLAVIPGSPADKAGIVENDIILEVDGTKIKDGRSLSSLIRTKNVGDSVVLKILHRGDEKTLQVKLERAPKGT